ncbi:hypothetical protein KP509_09G005800 [Ceratopteris richardii]|nr:hypothetical protein KP509_09G005800 [Ceratopteris richardii]
MFREMQEGSVAPNSYTFVSLLKACGNIADLNQGKKLHALAHIEGFTSLLHVGNTLISMYGKCGVVEEAVCVFSRMREWDIVSWNAMLSAYIDGDQGEKALLLYRQMQEEMVDPNMRTLVLALQACTAFVEERGPSAQLMVLEVGRAFHSLSRCRGYSSDVVMGTALLHMYGSCGSFMEAEDIFNALPNHDVVSWTALVSAYVSQGQGKKALFAYRQMHVEGVSPNDLTFSVVLQALRHVNNSQDLALERESVDWALEVGRALYSDIYNRGLTSNHTVGNPLISMFGQFHAGIPEAEAIFDALIERNIVSWNALLSSYVEHSEVENFLQLFLWLKRENLAFTDLTFIAVLQGCSELGNLELCRQVHFDIYSSEFDRYHSVIATLINAYGSSGSMTDAQAVFNELVEPHTVSCNACVAGHARDGHQEASLHFIDEMILESNVLDEATLTSILSACSHSGVVDKGFDYLHLVCTHYAMVPAVKHYGIMIDLLGRAGDFKHAERLLEMIPMPPDATLWLSLLSSCRFHGNLMLAKQAFISLLHVQPKHGAAYVLFSNLCAEIELEVFLDEADWNCGKVNHL